MSNTERSCIGCALWIFYAGWHGTDVTPGDGWTAECSKNHWRMEGRTIDSDDWFTTMQKAKTCADYDPRPGAPK